MAHSARPGQTSFALYLRTGVRIRSNLDDTVELKFNPYHDLRNGQFTFAPGGARSSRGASGGISRRPKRDGTIRGVSQERRGLSRQSSSAAVGSGVGGVMGPADLAGAGKTSQLAPQGRIVEPPGRAGNIRAFEDPMNLQQVFPGLNNAAGGAIVAVGNLFDVFGPANDAVAELMMNHTKLVISHIKAVDPTHRFESFGFPQTLEGQTNQLNGLRVDRAAVMYRNMGDPKPLQVETLRLLQRSTDRAYEDGLKLLNAGKLKVRLSPQEALGNYVDQRVRRDLRDLYQQYGISSVKGQRIPVNGREYDTSGTDATFRRPDARVENIAFDVTLTRKTLNTPQVRGFFDADFKPDQVVIIRPSKLGIDSTYIITRPENRK